MTRYGAGHRREYSEIPPLISGYPLDNYRISFYKSRAGVNLISNPSVERATTGYTAVGDVVAQSALQQRFGVYSLEVTPSVSTTSGVYYGTFDLSSGQLYFGSVWGLFKSGHAYTIYFANTSGTLLGTAYNFRGTGRWQRVSVAYGETSTAARRIYITKNGGTSLEPFYLDGLQVEADALTSYIDGDQLGFVRNQQAYYWTGTAHASPSVRVLGTRSGGEEVLLKDYGFSVLAVVGLGLGGFSNLATPNAYVGGSDYERTVYTERTFDIAGVFQADSDSYMRELRSDLVNVLRPNAGIITQPLTLRIQCLDECGRERGEIAEIPCVLEPSSLVGSWNNHFQDPVTLSFSIYLPYALGRQGCDGAELDFQDTPSVDFYSRSPNGEWNPIVNIGTSAVFTLLPLQDGRILIGGQFTNLGGDANADNLAVYDPSTGTIVSLNATPLNTSVNILAMLPDGNTVLVGGGFTNAGGDANADYLCALNLTTGAYSALNATPLNAGVTDIAVLADGSAIIGGLFTNAGGFADADKACKLTTAFAFAALNATPLNGDVLAVKKLLNGNVALSGSFTNAGGHTNSDGIGIWNATTSAYDELNTYTPTSPGGLALETAPDGTLYIGWSYTAANNIDSWGGDGLAFNQLGSGVNNDVLILRQSPDGTLIIIGSFTVAGGLPSPGLMGWNGSSYFYMDVLSMSEVAFGGDGTMYAQVYVALAASNTLTNNGTADTYPIFEFVGPGTVYQLRNYTTGDVLYFNLTLNAGERATLTLGPGNISFTSTFRGNIINTIIPGSSLATFRLTPGENAVSAFIAGTTDGNTRLSAYWKVLYQSFDNSLYR